MRGEGAGRGNDELQPPVILPGPLERRHKCSRPTSDSPSTSPISICPECPPLPSAFPFLARSGSLPSSSGGVSSALLPAESPRHPELCLSSRSPHHRGCVLYLTELGHPRAGLRELLLHAALGTGKGLHKCLWSTRASPAGLSLTADGETFHGNTQAVPPSAPVCNFIS